MYVCDSPGGDKVWWTTPLKSGLFWTVVIDFSVVEPNVQYTDSEPLPRLSQKQLWKEHL